MPLGSVAVSSEQKGKMIVLGDQKLRVLAPQHRDEGAKLVAAAH